MLAGVAQRAQPCHGERFVPAGAQAAFVERRGSLVEGVLVEQLVGEFHGFIAGGVQLPGGQRAGQRHGVVLPAGQADGDGDVLVGLGEGDVGDQQPDQALTFAHGSGWIVPQASGKPVGRADRAIRASTCWRDIAVKAWRLPRSSQSHCRYSSTSCPLSGPCGPPFFGGPYGVSSWRARARSVNLPGSIIGPIDDERFRRTSATTTWLPANRAIRSPSERGYFTPESDSFKASSPGSTSVTRNRMGVAGGSPGRRSEMFGQCADCRVEPGGEFSQHGEGWIAFPAFDAVEEGPINTGPGREFALAHTQRGAMLADGGAHAGQDRGVLRVDIRTVHQRCAPAKRW